MAEPQDPPTPAHIVGNASALLTAASLERWRDIVRRASNQGSDIAQLVQHFAERAFENKSAALEQQGSRRRALANLRQVVAREHQRADGALATQMKGGRLRRTYSAVRIDFTPPTSTLAQQANKKTNRLGEAPLSSVSDDHTWTVVPVTPAITHVKELEAYIEGLQRQGSEIDEELVKIDLQLNRGMANHARTVADLSAAAKELYRVAQEVINAMPQRLSVGLADGMQDETLSLNSTPAAAKPSTMAEEPTATMVSPQSEQNTSQPPLVSFEQRLNQHKSQLKNAIRGLFRRGGDKAKNE